MYNTVHPKLNRLELLSRKLKRREGVAKKLTKMVFADYRSCCNNKLFNVNNLIKISLDSLIFFKYLEQYLNRFLILFFKIIFKYL